MASDIDHIVSVSDNKLGVITFVQSYTPNGE
jgi:hypothetical protein